LLGLVVVVLVVYFTNSVFSMVNCNIREYQTLFSLIILKIRQTHL